MNAELVA